MASTGLVSAPISYFDELILACIPNEWRFSARVIGEAMSRTNEPFHQCGSDSFLFERLLRLMDDGVVEGRLAPDQNGNVDELWSPRNSVVRRS